MARTVNQEEYAAKRDEILDVALRLVYTKGYERMTIQDMLSDLDMSSGAFYHYFKSKPVVLEALIARIQKQAEQPLLPIVHDPHLSALAKFQRFFASLEQSGIEQQAFVADLLRVWFADDNAIVREKVYEAMRERRAPLLTQIIRQGIQEGVFRASHPDETSEVILSVARSMGSAIARLMIAFMQDGDELRFTEGAAAAYAAHVDAVERVLGAAHGSLNRYDVEAMKVWAAALRAS